MNKQEVYDFLTSRGIEYEVTEHGAVFNVEEMLHVELPHPEADAKNLFVRDDKKRNYYLITVRGDKRVDLKKFREEHGTRPAELRIGKRSDEPARSDTGRSDAARYTQRQREKSENFSSTKNLSMADSSESTRMTTLQRCG